jgi:hypothetical protein
LAAKNAMKRLIYLIFGIFSAVAAENHCSATVDGEKFDLAPLDGAFKEILEVVYTNQGA